MSQLPVWAQWVQLVATGAIALFAAFIAYKQWRLAQQRVVMDLFERRMAVYDEARDVIGSIVREGRADNTIFFRFAKATDRVEILFGDEVVAYVNATRERINKMAMHSDMLAGGEMDLPERKVHAGAKGKIMMELVDFYREFPRLM